MGYHCHDDSTINIVPGIIIIIIIIYIQLYSSQVNYYRSNCRGRTITLVDIDINTDIDYINHLNDLNDLNDLQDHRSYIMADRFVSWPMYGFLVNSDYSYVLR